MKDDELLTAFLKKSIPLKEWDHRKHLRLAWIHLRDHSLKEATGLMRTRIQEFNAAKGIENALQMGYHETMTRAWMHPIAFTMREHGAGDDSESFYETQPHLARKTLLRLYYSRDRICTEEAKAQFVEPDLEAFPESAS